MRACRSASCLPAGSGLPRPTTAPGFYGYHLAEHHATPIGCAASPGIFLAALAQRTETLRFGPLVYLLPFYHPLRLIEEVCMLDQLSGGRLEARRRPRRVAVRDRHLRRSISRRPARCTTRRSRCCCKGLAADELTFEGKFYRFDKVPMVLKPVQRPHPPLWYGVSIPDNADWPAAERRQRRRRSRCAPTVRLIIDRYRAVAPKLGKGGTDAAAASAATSWSPTPTRRRWRSRAAPIRAGAPISAGCSAPRRRAADRRSLSGDLRRIGGAADNGSPARRRRCAISSPPKSRRATRNYFVPWLAFGDMTVDGSR